jgi:hypothetical protein
MKLHGLMPVVSSVSSKARSTALAVENTSSPRRLTLEVLSKDFIKKHEIF